MRLDGSNPVLSGPGAPNPAATCTVLSDYLPADMAGMPRFVDELHTIWLTGAGAPEWLGMRCGKGSAAEASAAAALATEALALGFSHDEIRVLLSK